MKVLVVLGTRPEAIKLAPVIRELRRRSPEGRLETMVCVTAQHRRMLDQVLTCFGIRPDYDFDLMRERQTPNRVAAAVLTRLEPVLLQERPDWLLVQGDTTTVAAAALAAFHARVKIGHVEAGLRTGDMSQPFPEEMNRRIAGLAADLHFAPTAGARRNLLREGVPREQILVTGNPVIDALHAVCFRKANGAPAGRASARRVVLVTAHRRENHGAPLDRICSALRELSRRYGESLRIVFPVHSNPRVKESVYRRLGGLANVLLTGPLDYPAMVEVMRSAYLVMTDSGGVQEEAPSLGKPVLVLRSTTERPEAVAAGTVRLVGTDAKRIVAEAARLLECPAEYRRMAAAANPYGDGLAARRIVAGLLGERVKAFEPIRKRMIREEQQCVT